LSEPPRGPAAPPQLPSSPPTQAAVTVTIEHRVGFHETDAMGIVHHANYLRFCENARVIWLETHDKSYPEWIASGLHFAVTRVDLEYKQPARFDDRIDVTTWLEWVRGASLAMAYRIEREGTLLVSGWTEHASINDAGRVRRIPRQDRDRMNRHARVAAPRARKADESSPESALDADAGSR
jgi:acyl-CoA thioester hydrolase